LVSGHFFSWRLEVSFPGDSLRRSSGLLFPLFVTSLPRQVGPSSRFFGSGSFPPFHPQPFACPPDPPVRNSLFHFRLSPSTFLFLRREEVLSLPFLICFSISQFLFFPSLAGFRSSTFSPLPPERSSNVVDFSRGFFFIKKPPFSEGPRKTLPPPGQFVPRGLSFLFLPIFSFRGFPSLFRALLHGRFPVVVETPSLHSRVFLFATCSPPPNLLQHSGPFGTDFLPWTPRLFVLRLGILFSGRPCYFALRLVPFPPLRSLYPPP